MKKLACLIAVCSLCFGQTRSGVTTQNVFVKTAIQPQNSGLLNNIGNRSHLIYVLLENASSHTCSSPQTLSVGMEASFNNVNWSPFGAQVLALSGTTLATTQIANGAFPFIRVAVRSFDSTNCRLSVSYVGSVVQNAQLVFGPTNAQGQGMNGSFQNIIMGTQGISGTYTYSVAGADQMQIVVKGPANQEVRQQGTDNLGHAIDILLGHTDSNGNLVVNTPAPTAGDTGSWDTRVVVGLPGGSFGITIKNIKTKVM